MKRITIQFLTLVLVLGIFSVGCKKDKKDDSKVEDNGLTQEINNLIPDSIITKMVDLGMIINRGETPPVLNGTYFASPFVLKASNVPNDTPGYTFSDYSLTLFEQNNDNLSVKMDYYNGGESGTGIGGFVVGTNNKFTVFAEVNSTYIGYTAKMVHVVSGTLTATGIEDLYFANFMLDNFDNLGGIWIAEGEGRIIYDSDGFSEKETGKKSNASNLSVLPGSSGTKLR
ncbi:MAG: hypothetical protein FD166_512 [Bacteroidetes bacterium]|nr:MAG: hypothetical protein FD166_512 [Bacteroidota bacterium]